MSHHLSRGNVRCKKVADIGNRLTRAEALKNDVKLLSDDDDDDDDDDVLNVTQMFGVLLK